MKNNFPNKISVTQISSSRFLSKSRPQIYWKTLHKSSSNVLNENRDWGEWKTRICLGGKWVNCGSDANGFSQRRYERGMLVTSRQSHPARIIPCQNIPSLSLTPMSRIASSLSQVEREHVNAKVPRTCPAPLGFSYEMVRGPTILDFRGLVLVGYSF